MKASLSVITFMLLTSSLFAAEPEQIDKLVGDLASKDFATREAATKELQSLGIEAAPALAEVAIDGSLEARRRAFGILRKLYQSNDEKTKSAAKDALQKVADSETPGVSDQADQLLNPPKPVVRPFGGIQLQVQVAGGAGRKVSIRTVNGVKQIDAEENGQKVQITDDPQKGIKIKVTEDNEEGKEETKEYEAKNADELKKKHPDAHKLYEKYSKGPGINVIQMGIPQRFPFQPFLPARRAADVDAKVQRALDKLKSSDKADDPAAEIAAAMKLLEEVREQLKPFRAAGRLQKVEKRKVE